MFFEMVPNWHPIFVHFTIALFGTATLMFFAGYFGRSRSWSGFLTRAAYFNLLLGALITTGTIGAGFYAYYTVAHDGPSHAAMTDHRNWALATAAFWWILAIWSCVSVKRGIAPRRFLLGLLIGFVLLGTTGFKGGEAVYRYGLGVMSMPKVEGDGSHTSHSHDGQPMEHGKDGIPEQGHMPSASQPEHGAHGHEGSSETSPGHEGDATQHQH